MSVSAAGSVRSQLRQLAPWLVVSLAGWAVLLSMRRQGTLADSAPSWQRSVSTLREGEQTRYRQVRAAVLALEKRRSGAAWPEVEALAAEQVSPFDEAGVRWVKRQHGVYVNYLGTPRAPEQWRWLVLFIEPSPTAFKEPPAPNDEEHHTLGDGTALHVTVWTAPNEGPLPDQVLAFPVADGWVEVRSNSFTRR